MDGRQTFRLGCALALLVVAGLAGLAFYVGVVRPASPAATADRFLRLLARGKAAEAYDDAAPALRSRKTAGMLALEARRFGLVSYSHSSWDEVSVAGGEATLEGAVTTRSGDIIPLVVKLVQLDNRWRVLSVAVAPGDGDEAGDGAAPDG